MEGINVFIEFGIIEKSNPTSLYKELDLLILAQKYIHLWSKTKSPAEMKEYCSKIVVQPEDYSKEKHEQAYRMRHRENKTYKEISDLLETPISLVSFYVRANPKRPWLLSDWIVGYHPKDSSIYEKIDVLVDNDQRLVDKFKRAGRKANFVEKV